MIATLERQSYCRVLVNRSISLCIKDRESLSGKFYLVDVTRKNRSAP
jgi:hypothetical protein